MPTKGRPKLVVRFDADTLAQLQAAVGGGNDGMSGVVRQAVKEWLERRPAGLPRAQESTRPVTAVARIRPQREENPARTVACTACGAPAGTACRQNGRSRRPHRERITNARLAAASPARGCTDLGGGPCSVHGSRQVAPMPAPSGRDQESTPGRPGRPRSVSSGEQGDRSSTRSRPGRPRPAPSKKRMRVELWLRIERNSKFVRGMKKTREEIEDRILRRYGMVTLDRDGGLYHLTIPYETDEELEDIIDEIIVEADLIADRNNCFTESDVTSLDDPDRTWS